MPNLQINTELLWEPPTMNRCAAPEWNGRETIKNTDQAMRGIL